MQTQKLGSEVTRTKEFESHINLAETVLRNMGVFALNNLERRELRDQVAQAVEHLRVHPDLIQSYWGYMAGMEGVSRWLIASFGFDLKYLENTFPDRMEWKPTGAVGDFVNWCRFHSNRG